MKRLLPVLTLAAFLIAGCATPQSTKSIDRLVTPAPTVANSTGWTPTAGEIATVEASVANLLANPDQRVFGLGQNLPPHPFSKYLVRLSAAGPLDNKFIMGLAAMPGTVPTDEFLAPTTTDAQAVALAKSPENFQFIYNLKQNRLVEIRFTPSAATAKP